MQLILVPGAGGVAWYWHRVIPLLRAAGHDAGAVDLPGDDPRAGLDVYVDLTVSAIAGRRDTVLVGQSLGGFTVAMAAARQPVAMLVFLNAMIPRPGETPGEWWQANGQAAACTEAATRHGYSTEFDEKTYFLHDVPPELVKEGASHQRRQSDTVFGSPCEFKHWPKVPIHVLGGSEDRFFPIDFQRRVARERLDRELEVVPGGHLAALSRPRELTDRLLALIQKLA
jgi:pimeloyl-ACP methyl ester carboxylesterase